MSCSLAHVRVWLLACQAVTDSLAAAQIPTTMAPHAVTVSRAGLVQVSLDMGDHAPATQEVDALRAAAETAANSALDDIVDAELVGL